MKRSKRVFIFARNNGLVKVGVSNNPIKKAQKIISNFNEIYEPILIFGELSCYNPQGLVDFIFLEHKDKIIIDNGKWININIRDLIATINPDLLRHYYHHLKGDIKKTTKVQQKRLKRHQITFDSLNAELKLITIEHIFYPYYDDNHKLYWVREEDLKSNHKFDLTKDVNYLRGQFKMKQTIK